MTPPADRIERLQRRRTRIIFVQAVFFVGWQLTFFGAGVDGDRLVDHVKIAGYIVWALVLLALLMTGGAWWSSREERAVLNDESTREHRRRAAELGLWLSMIVLLVSYALNLFEPIKVRWVIHAALSAGIGTALFTFAALERRAQTDG